MTSALTEGYAPLEQYGSRARYGPYTDIYALGATLYHLLTGQVPISAPDRAQGVEMKAPHELRGDVSRVVSDAVMKAMEMDARDRPQTVDEFIALLKGALAPKTGAVKPQPSLTPQASLTLKQSSPPLPSPVVKPASSVSTRYLARKVGEKFGAISGALSGAVGGFGVGILAGLLLIGAGAIIGAIAGGLIGALGGAQVGDSESGLAALLGGLIGGAIIGYIVGIIIGVVLAIGATLGASAAGGMKGMQFGLNLGANWSERYGAVKTSLILSALTGAVMGTVWAGIVAYAYYDVNWVEITLFVTLMSVVGAVVGSSIGTFVFWHSLKKQGEQMPSSEMLTTLVSVPAGILVAWCLFTYLPVGRWTNVAYIWNLWRERIEEQLSKSSSRGYRFGFREGEVPYSPPPPSPTGKIRYVQVTRANIRSGPGTNFSVITVVNKGQALEVIEIAQNEAWAKVRLPDGRTGYINRKLLGVAPPK